MNWWRRDRLFNASPKVEYIPSGDDLIVRRSGGRLKIVHHKSRDALTGIELELAREANQPGSRIDIKDLGGADDALYLSAEIDGKVVGAATLDHFTDSDCELYKIYVLPDHRLSNVGTELVGAVMTEARARGVRELNIKVTGRSGAFWQRCFADAIVEQVPEVGLIVQIES